jgi:hypothetical protein
LCAGAPRAGRYFVPFALTELNLGKLNNIEVPGTREGGLFMENRREIFVRTLLSVSFLVMIVLNVLADLLPLGGRTTGQISDAYQTLFAPEGYTFLIWGLIYLLGAVHVLYQLGVFRGRSDPENGKLLRSIAVLFSVSSLANAGWILAWHFNNIPLSMALMAVILILLMLIMEALRRKSLTTREKLLVRLPFSVYFGWITVATIANAAALLVSLGWDRWGLSESFWMVVMLIAGVLIGALWIHRARDLAYALVLIWAYAGILVKHFTTFAGKYPGVIAVTTLCLAALVVDIAYVKLPERRKANAV